MQASDHDRAFTESDAAKAAALTLVVAAVLFAVFGDHDDEPEELDKEPESERAKEMRRLEAQVGRW